MRPRIFAVIAGSRLVYMTDADRIAASRARRFEAIAAE
jgi:hypothetical protein